MTRKRRGKNSGSPHTRVKTSRLQRTSKSAGRKARILPFPKIVRLVQRAKERGSKIVTTNGCFDILHVGHVRYLSYAKKLGDLLIVGVNSDDSVRKLKGVGRPICPERERAEVVASLRSVDAVFIFDDTTPMRWLKILKPDVHVKGADRSMREIVERKAVRSYGGRVVLAPFHKGRSTSAVIRTVTHYHSLLT
ncbi:D-glycero-beta-D-manno-heptose 1-phosphate adenylyltransferase [Candidatus Kaiserbacteria bacterium]|nr:D-glycero-beta-D-manno-heptose 1-phosphate adenylyltransferase [Candidatus Kaiserbacteria bacterium]